MLFSFLQSRSDPQALESHGRQFLQLLVERVDFDTEELQSRCPDQWLGVCVSEKNRACHDFPHESE